MTQDEKIVEGYVKLQEGKLLGMEANALRVLCEDFLNRAKKDREMLDKIKNWQLNTPTVFIDRGEPIPTDNLRIVLPVIINSFKKEVEEITDYMFSDKRAIWDNAVNNLEARLKQIIK